MELSSVTPPCMITPQAWCSAQMHHGRGFQAAYPHVFTDDDVPLPPVQIQTEIAALAQFLSSFTKWLIKQIHLSLSRPAPFPYTCPTAFRSSSTTYSTVDNNIPSHAPLLPPSQISSCDSQQGHFEYPFTVHLHYTMPPATSAQNKSHTARSQ